MSEKQENLFNEADLEKMVKDNGDKTLNKQELFNVLEFAQSLYNVDIFNATGVSPVLTKELIAQITTSSQNITKDRLKQSLKNIGNSSNQQSLIGYSEWLQLTEAVAKRTLSYLGNLPSFDYTFTCTNINSIEEYNSEEYKNDLQLVKEFLNKFNVRGQLSYVNRRTLAIDAFYGILRTEGDNWVFQELPYKYCRIAGKTADYGFMFDFNAAWFLKENLTPSDLPKSLRKIYRKAFGNSKQSNKKNSGSIWVTTSPLLKEGAFVCFKFDVDNYSTVPFLASLFSDEINKPLVRELQNNQYIIASQKLLVGLIPFIKDAKAGQVKDNLAIDSTTLGMFLALLKRGLSDCIKVAGVPFGDLKDITYDLPENNMYQEYSKSLSTNTGVTSRLIYSDTQLSATEVAYNTEIDEMLVTKIYPQYETWLSTIVNTFTQKYKFKFRFEGTNFSQNRKARMENAMTLADKGMVNFQKIASANGMNIFEFQEQLMFSGSSEIWKSLKLLPNVNTASEGSNESGRPNSGATDVVADSTSRNPNRETN